MRSCTGTRSVTATRVGSESRFQPKPEFAFRVSITVQSRYTGLDERDYRGYTSPAALSSKRTAYYVRVKGVVCAEFGGYRGGGGFSILSDSITVQSRDTGLDEGGCRGYTVC